MIKRISTFILLLCTPLMFAQIDIGIVRGPCFQKSVDRLGKKYVEWECDEYDNIVDGWNENYFGSLEEFYEEG